MEIETEIRIGTLDLTPSVQMRSRGREIVSKESKIRGGLHPTMDGDRDGAHIGVLEVRTAKGGFTH